MDLKRGDLVSIVIAGDYGKPRPALVVQDDAFRDLLSLTVLPLSSDIQNFPLFRITVQPTDQNGLRRLSQIMVDKSATVLGSKVGQYIGRLENENIRTVDAALKRFLGID